MDPHRAGSEEPDGTSAPPRPGGKQLNSPPAASPSPRDQGCLAHPGVDQMEIDLPAVSLIVLPAALDHVAVLADGRGEALVEGLALAPKRGTGATL